jgi:proline iminopeptidase
MKKKIFRFLKYGIGLLVAVLLFKIFAPKHYNTPPVQKRTSTKFMNLSTGSRIGYTLLTGKGIKKPYPIIYLHGGPGGRISNTSIEILSNLTDNGYDVYLYDQIGSGESDRLNDISEYTVDRHIQDLKDIIKNLGAERVILIGQSWGCAIATYFVSAYPEKIEKIIFTNPGPIYPYPSALATVKAPDSLQLKAPVFTNAQGNAKVKNLRTWAMNYCAIILNIKLASDSEADAFSTFASYEINKSCVFDTSKIVKIPEVTSIPSQNGYYAGIMTFQNLMEVKDPRPKLKDLNTPILVLKSQYDNQKWGFTHEYLTVFKNHQLKVVPNAGHIMEIEQPDLYLKYIQEFLK